MLIRTLALLVVLLMGAVTASAPSNAQQPCATPEELEYASNSGHYAGRAVGGLNAWGLVLRAGLIDQGRGIDNWYQWRDDLNAAYIHMRLDSRTDAENREPLRYSLRAARARALADFIADWFDPRGLTPGEIFEREGASRNASEHPGGGGGAAGWFAECQAAHDAFVEEYERGKDSFDDWIEELRARYT